VSLKETDSVRAPTRGLARRGLNRIHTIMSQQDSGLHIDTATDSEWFLSLQTERRLTVHVPPGASLRVEASAAQIEIAGVQGDLTVTNAAGNVTVRDVDVAGQVTVHQASGTVNFSGTLSGGRVDLRTVNGPVFATIPARTNAHIEASTVNGPIEIDRRLAVHTVRTPGSVQQASGEVGSGGPSTISLTTVSGPIFLRAR
jgi:phage baseplate assembly protein gpV